MTAILVKKRLKISKIAVLGRAERLKIFWNGYKCRRKIAVDGCGMAKKYLGTAIFSAECDVRTAIDYVDGYLFSRKIAVNLVLRLFFGWINGYNFDPKKRLFFVLLRVSRWCLE